MGISDSSWTFSGPLGDIVIVRRLSAGETRERLDALAVMAQLQRWLACTPTRRLLGSIYEALGGSGLSRAGMSVTEHDRALRERIQRALRQGEIVPLRARRRRTVVPVVHADEPMALGPEEERPTFIEVRLLDPRGEPVRNERVKLTLPTGEIQERRLDEDGFLRIEDVMGDTFSIDFLDRRPAAWERAKRS